MSTLSCRYQRYRFRVVIAADLVHSRLEALCGAGTIRSVLGIGGTVRFVNAYDMERDFWFCRGDSRITTAASYGRGEWSGLPQTAPERHTLGDDR